MFTVQPDMSENVQQYLNEIDLWHWNPFRLNQLTANRCLYFTMMKLWQRYNFSQRFKIAPQVLMAVPTNQNSAKENLSFQFMKKS